MNEQLSSMVLITINNVQKLADHLSHTQSRCLTGNGGCTMRISTELIHPV